MEDILYLIAEKLIFDSPKEWLNYILATRPFYNTLKDYYPVCRSPLQYTRFVKKYIPETFCREGHGPGTLYETCEFLADPTNPQFRCEQIFDRVGVHFRDFVLAFEGERKHLFSESMSYGRICWGTWKVGEVIDKDCHVGRMLRDRLDKPNLLPPHILHLLSHISIPRHYIPLSRLDYYFYSDIVINVKIIPRNRYFPLTIYAGQPLLASIWKAGESVIRHLLMLEGEHVTSVLPLDQSLFIFATYDHKSNTYVMREYIRCG